jgi:hypothetical protein
MKRTIVATDNPAIRQTLEAKARRTSDSRRITMNTTPATSDGTREAAPNLEKDGITLEAGRSNGKRIRALLPALALCMGLLFAGAPAANASVTTTRGATAATYSRCTPGPNGTTVTLEAHVGQEARGQTVAARFAVLDAYGWHWTNWATGSNVGWNYDDTVWFSIFYQGLRGTVTQAYVEYGWYRSTGWATAGEYLRIC